MMLRKIETVVLLVLACCAFAMGAQSQKLKVVPDTAAGVRSARDTIRVEWVQLKEPGSRYAEGSPVSADIYFAAAPAGGDLSKYRKVGSTINPNSIIPLGPESEISKRRTEFVPGRQGGQMGPGAYYCIVAAVEGADTIYSDYFMVMVESPNAPKLAQPRGNITGSLVATIDELSPRFTWEAVTGVPYYHIILSDEPIFTMTGSKAEPSDSISVIWQAIVPATAPHTSITYGAPDPSGANTAPPPPLMPGKVYSWMVLNNFGNHMAFTSNVYDAADLVTGQFRIRGEPIDSPRVVSPARGGFFNADDTPALEFKWTNLDTRAGSYLVNLFTAADSSSDLGIRDLGDLKVNMLVWGTTVARGDRGRGDTLSVPFNAAGTLTGGEYTLRVYAIDSRGAASTSARSTVTFKYDANTGKMNLRTLEVLGGIESPVGFVELRAEAVSGPTQAPLAFFTGERGTAERKFPVGTYRITAVKDGYSARTVTIPVTAESAGAREASKIYMSKPEAVLYGRVLAGTDRLPVNQARVIAVPDWGDTLAAITDGGGYFALSCGAARWTVSVEKAGYKREPPKTVTLKPGDNIEFKPAVLTRNPFALSGTVRNGLNEPVTGARVRLFREGSLIDELQYTPQNGAYVFYLASGSYTLTAEKAGFAMFTRNISVTGSQVYDVTLREGGVLVNGSFTGRSWSAETGEYVNAPITNAGITFEGGGETFIVTSDPAFGRFSASLPEGREYTVKVDAAGFDAAGYEGYFNADGELGATREFSGELFALAMIGGIITHAADDAQVPLGGVEVFVSNDAGRVVASGRSSENGVYEVRNIPNGGRFTVGAGSRGFYTDRRYGIAGIADGRIEIEPAVDSYNFEMKAGYKSIGWNVAGFAGNGFVRVASPLNAMVPFGDRLDGVGPGDYVVEAVAESDANLLHLSYHKFNVPDNGDAPFVDAISFPLRYETVGTLVKNDNGEYELSVRLTGSLPVGVKITRVELWHRSEGSARYVMGKGSRDMDISSINGAVSIPVSFEPARDGCNLYYYFIVRLSNGDDDYDVYGSSKQIFSTYVKPDEKVITRLVVEPGVSAEDALAGDALVMPSDYRARFSLKAFYSDMFIEVGKGADIGEVLWSVVDGGGKTLKSGSGGVFEYVTPEEAQTVTLKAVLSPSPSYTMKSGKAAEVVFPVRVTGAALSSMVIQRKGELGAIPSTGEAGFRVVAFDREGVPVTVSPQWRMAPEKGAGEIGVDDGVLKPAAGFFGNIRITATAGGKSAEYAYTESGNRFVGQDVYFGLRYRESGNDTVSTLNGLSLVFPSGSVAPEDNVELSVSIPELKNFVQKGSDEWRMADTIAFDLSCPKFESINGDIEIILDIPAPLRETAAKGGQEFRIARWFPDSLKWVPVESAAIINDGAAVVARLSKTGSRQFKAKDAKKAEADGLFAGRLAASSRYALVTKANKLSVQLAVSPHPFSPYIRPVKEYGGEAQDGTCIRVKIEAPEAFVRSVKVHIYNATGKRVWAIEDLSAEVGGKENRYWWNGRTSGRGDGRTQVSEEVWTFDFNERSKNRPLCRNGRYFVAVIVTDAGGKQKKFMKPVVLMK